MKLVKLTFPYAEWPLLRQTPNGEGRWGDYNFIINPDPSIEIRFDYWVVFNFLLKEKETSLCRNNLILITGEPSDIEPYSTEYVRQFDYVITSQKNIRHKNKFFSPQGLPWFVNKEFDELTAIDQINKTKKISVISSSKTRSQGHKKRLDFVMKLKQYFGEEIDLYGRGINDFEDKWNTLAPYKYSIAIENTSQKYYFTEKLMDCYLSLTFPIYFGCANIYDYFNNDSLVLIDINDFTSSIATIEGLLKDEGHYSESLQSLIVAKSKVLNEYNLFPLIVNFIEKHIHSDADEKFELRTLHNMMRKDGLFQKILSKIR